MKLNVPTAEEAVRMNIPVIIEKPPGCVEEVASLVKTTKPEAVPLFTLFHSACNPVVPTVVEWAEKKRDDIQEVKNKLV